MDNNDKIMKKRKAEKRKRQIMKNRIIFICALVIVLIVLIFFIQRKVFSVIDYNKPTENSSVTQQDKPHTNNHNSETDALEDDRVDSKTDNNINNESNSDSGTSDGESISNETSTNIPVSTSSSFEISTGSKDMSNTETSDVSTPSEVTEKSDIDKTQWNLLLVNPWNKLPEKFSVERTTLKNGHSIDSRAYPYLQKMLDDARAEGLKPLICSSYRTVERQQQLFDAQINKYLNMGYSVDDAEAEAAKWVAVPGTSEHHTALALDIVTTSYQILDSSQEKTAEQKWLMANSYKYGFVLRYPKDKTDITGIVYEPWHYRFVGVEAAKEMYENQMCLEEYLNQ